MEYDVTIDRDKFLGGSDIAVIMGISPFKTRWELLLEKAGLKENEFQGNKYTEYGHLIESQIRDYINEKYKTNFIPNRVIIDDLRFHTDGFDGECVLEVKSTSQIHNDVDDYKLYLVQLIKYMEANDVECGILAVYDRPEDFNPVFDPSRLQVFAIDLKDYKPLLNQVNEEIDRFRRDLAKLKENPLLCEEDFQPNELVQISNKIVALENRMAEYKALEQEQKQLKQNLFEAMQKYGVKSWETFNGTKITRVDGTEATVRTVEEFDLDLFKSEHNDLYAEYVKKVEKKTSGRSGYVKITVPKGV